MPSSVPPPRENKTYMIDAENAGEMARLAKQDRLVTEALGGPFPEHVNLSAISAILDIACGPGSWVLRVATSFPSVQVTGIDISNTMIDFARGICSSTPNAHFRTMDATQPLDFPDSSFDYIHARLLFGFMPRTAWSSLLEECSRLLRPGGILRVTESEVPITNQLALEQMSGLVIQALLRASQSFSPDGRTIGITSVLGRLVKDAGFEGIHRRSYTLDFSAGSGIEADFYHNYEVSSHLIQPFLVKMGVTTSHEATKLYNQGLQEMRSPDLCAIWYFLSVWGNKNRALK